MEFSSKLIEHMKSLYVNEQWQELLKLFKENFANKVSPYNTYNYAKKLSGKVSNLPKLNPLNTANEISVITVNYNNLNGLKETIKSVLRQTARKRIQFIIVDGMSTDGSLEYLKTLEEQVDIIVYGKDSGVYDAMNRGIELADSKYSIFMNSGDCFDSNNVVEELLSLEKENNTPDFIYGAARHAGGSIWNPIDGTNLWKGMICCHQSAFFRTSILKEIQYSTHNNVVSDYELILKCYTRGSSFHKTSMVISNIEPVGISADFGTRTLERWLIVRSFKHENVTTEEIDDFYRTLLATKGEWASPQNHLVNEPQNNLISNIEQRIVFLISMPRSGSTLLQRILDKSKDIATAGEPWFMLPLTTMYDDTQISARYGQHLNIMAKNEFIKDTGLSNIITDAQKVYADSIYSTTISKVKKRYFLDKTPRYVHIVDALSKIYPRAKFIVLKRNPAAIVSSYANTWYDSDYEKLVNDEYAKHDFTEGFLKLGKFVQSSFKNKIVVNYEDLISDPEEQAAKIFNYLRLPFDKDFINYNKGSNISKFAFGDPSSVYSKNRPCPSHNEKWIKELKSSKQAKHFLKTMDLIPIKAFKELGYDITKIKERVETQFNLKLPSSQVLTKQFGRVEVDKVRPEINEPPSLGVLITCFNNEFTIKESIESVISQSKKPDLVVVSDDCSTDSSVKIVQDVISRNPQIEIQLILRNVNVGVSENRDTAIRDMDSDFITTLDGDDMFYPGKLEAEYNALIEGRGSVAFSDIVILGEKENVLISTAAYNNVPKNKMIEMLCGRSAPVPRDMMFAKELFLKASGFDIDMEIYEDWALKMRLMGCLNAQEKWVHSGVIGTVYDRRNPGLSGRLSIVHAYGQLLAISRNANLFLDNKKALLAGLTTVVQQLNGNVKVRLLKFVKSLSQNQNFYFIIKRLKNIWFERSWKYSTEELNTLIWKFSSEISKNELMIKLSDGDFHRAPSRFVVCTPVFNGEKTIERTILSVVEQAGYFDVQYHIQDGGSTDGTLNILKKWEKKISDGTIALKCNSLKFTYESQKDRGMYDAISKSFEKLQKSPSSWLTWINADDYFEPNAFSKVSDVDSYFDRKIKWLTGSSSVVEIDGNINRSFRPLNRGLIKRGLADGDCWNFVQQEGTFFRGELWDLINVSEDFCNFRYAGDWNLWRKFAEHEHLYLFRNVLANFCKTEGQLSEVNSNEYLEEINLLMPKVDRNSLFLNFPVSEGTQLILEYEDSKLKIKNGSVLGQFSHLLNTLV